MSTHLPGFQLVLAFLHCYVLTTSSQTFLGGVFAFSASCKYHDVTKIPKPALKTWSEIMNIDQDGC